jgi:hypothetical protein
VSVDVLAKHYELTAAQVAAVGKAVQEETAIEKIAIATKAEHAKLEAEYWHVAGTLSHDTVTAQITDVQRWVVAQTEALAKAKTLTQETYADILNIATVTIDAIIQKTLEQDPHTQAHYKKVADEAAAAYAFALQHMDQYTAAELVTLQDAADAAALEFADWQANATAAMESVGAASEHTAGAVDHVTSAVRASADAVGALAGSVAEATAQFNQLNDLAGRGGSVPGGGSNANVTPWYDTQAGRSQSFATMMLNKSYQESGIAFVPGRASGGAVTSGAPYLVGEQGPELFVPGTSGAIVPHGAGGATVIVQSGAVQLTYPIVNDPRALDGLARIVGEAVLAKLTRAGARL